MTATRQPMLWLILSALVGAFLLSGCSLIYKAAEHPDVAQAVVKNRTLAFIDGDPAKAERVERVASKVQELVDTNPEVRPKKLREAVEEAVPWGELSELEARSLRALIVVIEQGLDKHASDALNRQDRLYLDTTLTWVIESARIVP